MSPTPEPPSVEVLWRPGCGYCARLRSDLRRRGVPATYRNIWQDDEARRTVTRVNHGNETVPTVRVGDTWMTNPSGSRVAEVASAAGVVLTEPIGPSRSRLVSYSTWIPVVGLVVAGELISAAGHEAASLGLDVAAIGAWWLTRPLRR